MGGVRGCVEGMGEEEAVGTWIGMLYACYILYIIYKNESINTKRKGNSAACIPSEISENKYFFSFLS